MSSTIRPDSLVRQPGAVVFPENHLYVAAWETSGGSAKQQGSGHWVLYNRHGLRLLYADPEGTVLHECAWTPTPLGPRLRAVRMRLDWGQWVGIKPDGLINRTVFDLSKRPGWQSMSRDDLRLMAARALNTSLDTVRFFYPDEDLVIHPSGEAVIHQRKDAFYILSEGRFDGAKFMSCMSRMHWHAIDYLPVVELFLSLLPGTGSATFELIRGLYDDQNPEHPRPLRYRGIPPYPSIGAYHLFRQFFIPSLKTGADPLPVFLDPAHAHEVLWTPTPDPPMRYFEPEAGLCITVKGGMIQKVTDAHDSTGLPFYGVHDPAANLYRRRALVQGKDLVLEDGFQRKQIPLNPLWKVVESPQDEAVLESAPSDRRPSWRDCFPDGPPQVTPQEAFSAVLLYPEDDTPIGERESQPFVFDYFDDLLDEAPDLQAARTAQHVLIEHCDGALGACVRLETPKDWTIVYTVPALAQKHAQTLWARLVQQQHDEWVSRIRFFADDQLDRAWAHGLFDLVYLWLPFAVYDAPSELKANVVRHLDLITSQGFMLMAGPRSLAAVLHRCSVDIILAQPVDQLPTFRIHQSILPRANIRPDLTAYIIKKA